MAGDGLSPGNGRRVLVVDDDALNRSLAARRLRDAGFIVETAATAEAALQIAAGAPPDAILSDIQMPRMDGFQLREAIRSDAALSRIPVVLLSSARREEEEPPGRGGLDGPCVARTSDLRAAIDALAAALDDPPYDPIDHRGCRDQR